MHNYGTHLLCKVTTASIILICIWWKSWSVGSALSHEEISLSKQTLSAVNIDHRSVNNCTLPAIKPQDTLLEHQTVDPCCHQIGWWTLWWKCHMMTGRQSVGAGMALLLQRAQPWLLSPPEPNAVRTEFIIIYLDYMMKKRMKRLPEAKHELNTTNTSKSGYSHHCWLDRCLSNLSMFTYAAHACMMYKSFGERLPGFNSLPTFLQWESVQPRLWIDAELRSQVCGMASSYHRTSFPNTFAGHARYSQTWSHHWMITPRMEFISVNCKPDIFHFTTNEFSCKTSKRHQSLSCYF